jgi:membrane associated rhomboid family serine protease
MGVHMASSPELFVVCKNCRSQVSPYITECPYCGQRLRKRAPKIERGGEAGRPKKRRAAAKRPGLGPLRTGEIPGIRGDEFAKPRVTIALVAIAALWWLATIPLRDDGIRLAVDPLGEWWQVLTAPFINSNGWYQFAALGAIGVFGWLLERRHGPVPVLVVWLLAASGGMALVKLADIGLQSPLSDAPFAVGASGGALGLLCAWAVPVLLARRRRADMDDDADMIGVGVIFVLLALMPAAREDISVIATVAGILIGTLCGLVLARLRPAD